MRNVIEKISTYFIGIVLLYNISIAEQNIVIIYSVILSVGKCWMYVSNYRGPDRSTELVNIIIRIVHFHWLLQLTHALTNVPIIVVGRATKRVFSIEYFFRGRNKLVNIFKALNLLIISNKSRRLFIIISLSSAHRTTLLRLCP